jgi:hypothetical protein
VARAGRIPPGLAVALVLLAAGCGGSSTGAPTSPELAAECEQEAALVQELREPRDLRTARRTLRTLIALETRLLAALRPGDAATMSPLRTAAPSARRVLVAARGLVVEMCQRAA